MSVPASRSDGRRARRLRLRPGGRAAIAVAAAAAAGAAALSTTTAAASPAAGTAPAPRPASQHSAQQTQSAPQRAAWRCDSGYVCLYEHRGGTDDRCQYTRSQHDLTRGTWACRFAPTVGSVYNLRPVTVRLYERTGCAGPVVATVGPHKKATDVTRPVRSLKVGNTTC